MLKRHVVSPRPCDASQDDQSASVKSREGLGRHNHVQELRLALCQAQLPVDVPWPLPWFSAPYPPRNPLSATWAQGWRGHASIEDAQV